MVIFLEISLNNLPFNKTGKIINLNVKQDLKRRLLDLGFVKDTKIKMLYKSPLKDPKAYLIRGSVISLRDNDTKNIIINIDEEDDNIGSNK